MIKLKIGVMMNDFLEKQANGIYLSKEDIKILNKYEIDYLSYNNIHELLFSLEDIINNNYVDSDLEDLLIKLSEYNYYFNTNK